MSSQKDTHLENVRSIQAELAQILDGMDYCLDWKPDTNSWSAREVVYHLLDTPPGGIHRILRGMFSGMIEEFDLVPDLNHMRPERQGYDMVRVQQDISRFFQGMTEAIGAAAEGDFEEKSALAHLKSRGRDEPRTARMLLEGLFARHWREHLEQIRSLRESLGV